MGRTGRQKAHAHDVFFFGGTLAQIRQPRISCAQIPIDAGNEYHEQRGIEGETDEQ